MKLGPYEVLEPIGQGGMGAVFQARGPDGSLVAIKVLLKVSEASVARFERERRLIGVFTARDGFVPLLDSGTSPHGPFLVMPFMTDGTLRDRIKKGPLDVDETLTLGRTLAEAIARAHERGIVHRDLKPENILFDSDRALIADLGLAKHFGESAMESADLSRTQTARGTVGYMAPEQAENAKHVGPAADVFALGAILYECLAGDHPFAEESSTAMIARAITGNFAPLRRVRPDVPRWLAQVVERALAPVAKTRFADGVALRRALGGPQGAVRSRAAVALVAGGLLVAGASGALLVLGRGAPAAPRSAPAATPAPASAASATREARDWAQKAEADYERDDMARALADATRAIELDANLAQAWEIRGLARVGRAASNELMPEARKDLDRALELDPRLGRALAARGVLRSRAGDADGTEADCTRAIELGVSFAGVYTSRAWARSVKKDYAGSIADAQRAVELEPRSGGAWYSLGLGKSNTGDLEGAVSALTRAVELTPEFARAWSSRADALKSMKDFDRARADYDKAIELDPKDAHCWQARGWVRAQKGDQDGAIADYTRALELGHKSGLVWINRGLARQKKRDWAGSIADLKRGLEIDAHCFSETWAWIGIAHVRLGDAKEAVADFTKQIEVTPKGATAWNNRGWAKAELGDWDGVLEDCTHALDLDPKLAFAWMNRGRAKAAKGQLEEGLAECTKAVELDPKSGLVLLHRARVKALMGDSEGARVDFERSLELDPDSVDADKARAGLEALPKR